MHPGRAPPAPASVSEQMRRIIERPIRDGWNLSPQSQEEWRHAVRQSSDLAASRIPGLLAFFGASMRRTMIDGVRVHVVTPAAAVPRVAKRSGNLLLHLHGGCYTNNIGPAGAVEAILMAGFSGYEVVSIDYRTPPDWPFPTALDDCATVWAAISSAVPPSSLGVLGTSAGGALTLSLVHLLRQRGLPLPGAIAPCTPMSDLTEAGDSFQTNAFIDNDLVAANGRCAASARLYADGADLRDPLLSPLFGEFGGFPPTILVTGTRDLLLSSTIGVHRKLRNAGVETVLDVYEGQAHAHYLQDHNAPETEEVFRHLGLFFEKHLAACDRRFDLPGSDHAPATPAFPRSS